MKIIFKLVMCMVKGEYKTKQKVAIIEYIKKVNDFTIKELCENLSDIGETTIYREINKLLNDGILVKLVSDNNTLRYQYVDKCNCDNHMYLKCNKCGKMFHVDCSLLNGLKTHVKKEHNFSIANNNLIVGGTCLNCIKNEVDKI